MRPKNQDLCAKPYCRQPAEVYVHLDTKTGRISPDCPVVGFCMLHDAERTHQAMLAWEKAHEIEIADYKAKAYKGV